MRHGLDEVNLKVMNMDDKHINTGDEREPVAAGTVNPVISATPNTHAGDDVETNTRGEITIGMSVEPASMVDAQPETVELSPTAVTISDPLDPKGTVEVEGMELRPVLEAILFSTDAPISAGKLAQTVGLDSTKPIKASIAELNTLYGQRHAAYRIEERAGGYQLLTLPQYAQYIQRLTKARDEGRLTPAALETLAIIAYRQPILRVDVESIRGVACGEVIRTLMEYNLVKIVGRAEEIGRPMLYGTTKHFLEVFGLSSLKDLPSAEQLKEPKAARENNE